MEEALKLINQPVIFRHNGSRNHRIGIIKGIYAAKYDKAIIAVVKLEKSAKKTGFFSKMVNALMGEEDDEVRIPINLLHVLTDVQTVNKRKPLKDEYVKTSTDRPQVVHLRGDAYTTIASLETLQFSSLNVNKINPGCDVIWNKNSIIKETNPIGCVAYFAYRTDILGNQRLRVCVDFVDQPAPVYKYNDEYLLRVLCQDKGVLFRYCVPYEELMGLEKYLMEFQQFPAKNSNDDKGNGNKNFKFGEEKNLMDFEDVDSAKSKNGKTENEEYRSSQGHVDSSTSYARSSQGHVDSSTSYARSSQGHVDSSSTYYTRSSNSDDYNHSHQTWTTVVGKRGHSAQSAPRNQNNTYGTVSTSTQYEYEWTKKFFAPCCAQNKCDRKNEDIPLASVVAYLKSIPEPTLGKVLWIGNVGIIGHPYLQSEIHVELEFESPMRSGSKFTVEHVYDCHSGLCRNNERLFISLTTLRDANLFKIYPMEIEEKDEEASESTNMDEVNDYDKILPPPLELPSILSRLRNTDQWGFQGCNNSCYADTTLLTLFAFTDVFDSTLDEQQKDEASGSNRDQEALRKETVQILRRYIVGPIRKNFYVSKQSVSRLRGAMSKVNPEFRSSHMDVEDFMLCLFDTVLGVPGFFRLDKDYSDYVHQIMLMQDESPVFSEWCLLQNMLHDSFFTSQVQLEDVPHPGFVIKLPVCDGKLMNCKYVLPDLKLDLTHILKNPTGKTSMDLLSVICLRDSHFTCFIKIDTHWFFYDSNPSEKRPKVVRVTGLTESLQDLRNKAESKEFKLERYLTKTKEEYAQYLMSSAYICVYI